MIRDRDLLFDHLVQRTDVLALAEAVSHGRHLVRRMPGESRVGCPSLTMFDDTDVMCTLRLPLTFR
jgi:hypothetical protein